MKRQTIAFSLILILTACISSGKHSDHKVVKVYSCQSEAFSITPMSIEVKLDNGARVRIYDTCAIEVGDTIEDYGGDYKLKEGQDNV